MIVPQFFYSEKYNTNLDYETQREIVFSESSNLNFINFIENDGIIRFENDFKEKYLDKVGKKYDITKYSKNEFIYLLHIFH